MRQPKPSKTVISHGSSFEGIRLTVRGEFPTAEATVRLTPTETAELAHRLLVTLFQVGYEINARKRS